MKKIIALLMVLALVLASSFVQLRRSRRIYSAAEKERIAYSEDSEKGRGLEIDYLEDSEAKEDDQAENSIVILAFGDLMLGRYVRTLMDRHGKDYIFERLGEVEEVFEEKEDIVFANLEGPIEGDGYESGLSMRFGFNEDVAPFLKDKGFNLLSIANNHTLDQGIDGLKRTRLALEENGVGWCGDPAKVDSDNVFYAEFKRQKIAFVCFNDVQYRLDDEAAIELINEVRERVDYLIVSIHWGVEYEKTAHQKLQVERAHNFVDAGADLVIGHHPHVVQNYENYKNRLIIYSLGNFVFDQYWSTETQKGLAVGIILNKEEGVLKTSATFIPLKSEKSQVFLDGNSEEYDII